MAVFVGALPSLALGIASDEKERATAKNIVESAQSLENSDQKTWEEKTSIWAIAWVTMPG